MSVSLSVGLIPMLAYILIGVGVSLGSTKNTIVRARQLGQVKAGRVFLYQLWVALLWPFKLWDDYTH